MANDALIPFLIAGSILLMVLAGTLIYLFIFIRTKLGSFNYGKLAAENHALQLQVEEYERMLHEAARYIHDNISQGSAVIKMQISMLKKSVADDKNAKFLDNASECLDSIIQGTSAMRKYLNCDYIRSTGLITAVSGEAKRICGAVPAVEFEIEGEPEKIQAEQKLLIYRIAQEALQNIVKHASATKVTVLISCVGRQFSLLIRDNGFGMPLERLYTQQAQGVKSMRDRAKCLNGHLTIQSHPGKGCSVKLLIKDIEFNLA